MRGLGGATSRRKKTLGFARLNLLHMGCEGKAILTDGSLLAVVNTHKPTLATKQCLYRCMNFICLVNLPFLLQKNLLEI